MAGTKTIFNSTALECYRELLLREHGVVLEANYVNIAQLSVGPQLVTMRITAVPGPGGISSQYRNSVDYVYNKIPLSQLLPTDISYGGPYPCTFTQFRNFMRDSYGWLIEESELELDTGSTTLVLAGAVEMNVAPDDNMTIRLNVRTGSGRFLAEQGLRIYISSPDVVGWTRLQISGNAPDGVVTHPYNYAYTVVGGIAPYTFSIVGFAPAVLNPNTGAFEGEALNAGQLNWIVRVEDARGFTVDYNDSALMTVAPLEFVTPQLLPNQLVATPIDILLDTTGGAPPFTYSFASTRPQGFEIDASTGRLTGVLELVAFTFTVRCLDGLGTVIEKDFLLNVQSRPHATLAQSILDKTDSWFEFDEGSFPDAAVLEAIFARSGQPNQLTVHGAAVGGPGVINLNGQTLTGQQNFINEGGVVYVGRGSTPATGTGLIGRATDVLGWELYVDEMDANRLRFDVKINGQTYGVRSDAAQNFFSGNPTTACAQRAAGRLTLHCNTALTGSEAAPEGVIDYTTSVDMTIGRRTRTIHQTTWNTQLDRMIFFRGRMWSDELFYLHNGGMGRRYLDVVDDAT